MSSTRTAARKKAGKRQTAAKRVGAVAGARPEDFPPARVALFAVATKLLHTIFNLPADMDIQGVQISEDGETLGFFVEWPKMPEIRYGQHLPALIGTLEPGAGLLPGEKVLTLEKLRWEQQGNSDAYLWLRPSATSRVFGDLPDVPPPGSELLIAAGVESNG